jgi:hypothetical protein
LMLAIVFSCLGWDLLRSVERLPSSRIPVTDTYIRKMAGLTKGAVSA